MKVARCKVTVIVDNRALTDEVETTWGFAALVETSEGKVLFDVGPNYKLLLKNAEKLSVDLSEVDAVFISHWHGDHAGALLDMPTPKVLVIPTINSYVKEAMNKGCRVLCSSYPFKIFEGVYSTGRLGGPLLREHSLVVDVEGFGGVVLVGCSHPGLEKILARAEKMGVNPRAVIGGFHVGGWEAKRLVNLFERVGVKQITPCHCTSEDALWVFQAKLPGRVVDCGVGRMLTYP